jgi:hypothetical protein
MIPEGALDNPPLAQSDCLMAAWTVRRECTHPVTVGDSLVNDNRVVVLCRLPDTPAVGDAIHESQRPQERRPDAAPIGP